MNRSNSSNNADEVFRQQQQQQQPVVISNRSSTSERIDIDLSRVRRRRNEEEQIITPKASGNNNNSAGGKFVPVLLKSQSPAKVSLQEVTTTTTDEKQNNIIEKAAVNNVVLTKKHDGIIAVVETAAHNNNKPPIVEIRTSSSSSGNKNNNKNNIDNEEQIAQLAQPLLSSTSNNNAIINDVSTSSKVAETDFYYKPTILSRLILNQKYKNAIKRIYKQPNEASIWVCSKIKKTKKKKQQQQITTTYTIRQLPIHIACDNLCRTYDEKLKKLLNEVIVTLIYTNPIGAYEPDHKNRIPLHIAIWYGAAKDTIALFLMAKPDAVHMKDYKGRTLSDLNKHRMKGCGEKESIQHLLDQGIEFWNNARNEANIRLQHNSTICFPISEVNSISVVASPKEESSSTIYSIMSKEEQVQEDENDDNVSIPSIAWDQLEKRSIATEQILTEINERNYELSKKVEALTIIDMQKGNELVSELTRLDNENSILNEKLHGIENLLLNTFVQQEEDQQQYRLALAEISSLMGLSEKSSIYDNDNEPLLQVTKDAHQLCKQLSKKQIQQREKIRKVQHVLEELLIVTQKKDGGNNTGGGSDDVSTISALTSHSAHNNNEQDDFSFNKYIPFHPKTATNNKKHIIESSNKQNYNEKKNNKNRIDDLDTILKYAAAKDQAKRMVDLQKLKSSSQKPCVISDSMSNREDAANNNDDNNNNNNKDNNDNNNNDDRNKYNDDDNNNKNNNTNDDLSVILRWAAKNDNRGVGLNNNNNEQQKSVSSSWSPITPIGRRSSPRKLASQRDLSLPPLFYEQQ